ncbi:DUF2190 family protein [Halobacteriovorax sp. GB3]|uniref:DUF2190 family protein n=1 Tax=Halobacteriovorax sp. GB3 TaxID=2719615 RepID=UPI0023607501|nr:DUF2190 family protein [Halobacteriovorax sp. GB3]MDD0852990.1 DUF2190 family protein [Halobacteriovorax sp. GB3]
MKNKITDGKVIEYAHSAAVTSGQALLVGALIVVALKDYDANELGIYERVGVYELPCVSTDVVATPGVSLYWDDAAKKITATSTDNTFAGVSYKAKADGEETIQILLK